MDVYWWFALRSVPYVGNVLSRRLLERFGAPEKVFSATSEQLSRVDGIGPKVVESILRHDYHQAASCEHDRVNGAGVRIVTLLDGEYPELLRQTTDPPPYLYVRGSLENIGDAVAVVGSRNATSYGRTMTARIVEGLARGGVVVVSGLARGIDTVAHGAALKGGGRTIGILGCGIDIVYPPENRRLFDLMAEDGAVVSEFPMGTMPLAENFPRRNRIISGMSRGVLVVEAAENSGSLITAQLALEQGRDVFAIPGNLTSGASRGANRLIKQGAKLVEDVADILEELPSRQRPAPSVCSRQELQLDPEERRIYSSLQECPLHIDDITAKCGLTAGEVSAMLLRLELKGVVAQHPGMYYSLP